MHFPYLKSFLGAIFVLAFSTAFSQQRALGTWKSFMPYGSSLGVLDAGDKVYSAAEKSIFSYDKSSGEIQIYDKASGLNDVGIKTINYDPSTKILVIAYTNNNLDLIYNGTDIYNIPDIKNGSFSGSIAINNISFYGGNAYISSDIGISVVNLTKKEISNTYIIGATGGQTKVYATTIDGTNIYAATEEGVKYAPLSSSNLQNFNSWILFGGAENLSTKRMTGIAAYNGKVYAISPGTGNAPDTICEYNGTIWQKDSLPDNDTIISLAVVNNNLYFSTWNQVNYTGKNWKIDGSGNISSQQTQGHVRPVNWFESNAISWEADIWNGLFKNNQGNVEKIIPSGPFSSSVNDIEIKAGSVYISPGGADDYWFPAYNKSDGFFIYKNDEWMNSNQSSNSVLANLPAVISCAAIPTLGKAYFASFLYGLGEFSLEDNSIRIYNKDNSILQPQPVVPTETRISCVTADKYNNVWMGNAGVSKPIKVLKPDGSWGEFSIPSDVSSVIKKIMVDQYDQLWMPLRYTGAALMVWSYNHTLDDPSDDSYRLLNTGDGSGGLPDGNVFSIAEDNDGNIWVGTNQGIAVYYCASSIISDGCNADQIKVERDGYIGYLFGTESVRAICVDAANRKWVGTTNGLWLVSADGKQELLKFTVENSPLPANQITDIAIEDKTGEVFIGTAAGLVSYLGDAIAGCKDCKEALVYPNPVKPDYAGPIAIKGLADNAYVKITDVAGTLVFQGKANGTQMVWDGRGYNGQRAKSGVYLVLSSTDLGKEKKVAKILIAN
jgi:hypothetical protein